MKKIEKTILSDSIFVLIGLAAVTGFSYWVLGWLDIVNVVMLYLFVVFLVALKLGKIQAIIAALISVVLFDYFFISPQFSFAVDDLKYLITFLIMLFVGVTTAYQASIIRAQKIDAEIREQVAQNLYRLAKELNSCKNIIELVSILKKYAANIGYSLELNLIDKSPKFIEFEHSFLLQSIALTALNQRKAIDVSSYGGTGSLEYLIPLFSQDRSIGVIHLISIGSSQNFNNVAFGAIADLTAIALDRIHYEDEANQARIETNAERLKSSILSAISHDLRTPLAALVGMAESLERLIAVNQTKALEYADLIRTQSWQLNNLVHNLVDMTTIDNDKVIAKKEWHLLEDVIGSAINFLKPISKKQNIKVSIESDFPLVEFDAILIERVICNLIENAFKHSQSEAIEINVSKTSDDALVEVRDHGRGFEKNKIEMFFNLFERGNKESPITGIGLGLSISKAIIHAHGGSINIKNHKEGGASVTFSLPLGTPPAFNLD